MTFLTQCDKFIFFSSLSRSLSLAGLIGRWSKITKLIIIRFVWPIVGHSSRLVANFRYSHQFSTWCWYSSGCFDSNGFCLFSTQPNVTEHRAFGVFLPIRKTSLNFYLLTLSVRFGFDWDTQSFLNVLDKLPDKLLDWNYLLQPKMPTKMTRLMNQKSRRYYECLLNPWCTKS